jgi:hypothetical protein
VPHPCGTRRRNIKKEIDKNKVVLYYFLKFFEG